MIWIALIVVLFVVIFYFLGWLEGCSGVVGLIRNSLKRISVFFACMHCWGAGLLWGHFFNLFFINCISISENISCIKLPASWLSSPKSTRAVH